MEHGKLDFDETVQLIAGLSTKAQATFFFKVINHMGPMVLRTIIRYCGKRLDVINRTLPDDHPNKEKYLSYGRNNKLGTVRRFSPSTNPGKEIDPERWNRIAQSSDLPNPERW